MKYKNKQRMLSLKMAQDLQSFIQKHELMHRAYANLSPRVRNQVLNLEYDAAPDIIVNDALLKGATVNWPAYNLPKA